MFHVQPSIIYSPHIKQGRGERGRNTGREDEKIGSKGGHKVRNEAVESRRRKLDVEWKLMNGKCKGNMGLTKRTNRWEGDSERQIHDRQDRARTWNWFLWSDPMFALFSCLSISSSWKEIWILLCPGSKGVYSGNSGK